jgi:hypothetical protein
VETPRPVELGFPVAVTVGGWVLELAGDDPADAWLLPDVALAAVDKIVSLPCMGTGEAISLIVVNMALWPEYVAVLTQTALPLLIVQKAASPAVRSLWWRRQSMQRNWVLLPV